MKTYKITIEEHISETFEVEANSLEEAMQKAEQSYYNEEFIIGPNVTARLMQGATEDYDEVTDWVEF
jgi:hypothetical protein